MKNYTQTIRIIATVMISGYTAVGQTDNAKIKPNILLFLVDDMGWQDTSVPFWIKKTPLNEIYQTPNMKRLASEGMKFTQAYACSVCFETVQKVDGKSFVPMLLRTGTTSKGRDLFWHFPNKWGPQGPGIGTTSTIRSGEWKLIYWYKDGRKELYNIADDIGENSDLAELQPEIVRDLSRKLGAYLKSVGAKVPVSKITGIPCPYPGDL